MAFSDLCHISNAYKTVENEPDQSERIMEENSMVRDLITKILDETGPSETSSSMQPPEKTISGLPTLTQYPKSDPANTSFIPPSYNYQDNLYFGQNDQGFNYNLPNGFQSNGFNFTEDSNFLGIDTVDTSADSATPEQLNLLRLAAQEIGGAQFAPPNKFEDKFFNYFENQRTQESQFLYNRPNSLNLDVNFNNYDNYNNRYQKFDYEKSQNSDSADILSYLSQLNMSSDRTREEPVQNMDFKMPDISGQYQSEQLQDSKAFFNRNFQQMPPKNFNGENNFYLNEMIKQKERVPLGQNYEYQNQTPVSGANSMNYKPNGFHPNEFMQRNQPRDGFNVQEQRNFDGAIGRENMQQAAIARQNQELARQMTLLMRNRPPPNQLNVDVSFLHENTPFNLGLGALLGPSPAVPPPVLPSPMLDLPLLAPFYAMRNMRGAATSSAILHLRLDACYEQWRQLERERKRTEARLALAYPGRAVSSSNSIPVPRLPPCPTRVDRLTIDMLREHTKVLTLMGKMETLRASVCVAQNKRPNQKSDDVKVTVLKRGEKEKERVEKESVDPETFDPSTWREDIKNLAEIAPHSEVESAMLSWRSAVAAVQAARRRELHTNRYRTDPILQLSEAVAQLCACARRARCAMWCDLTLTVALAPHSCPTYAQNEKSQSSSVQTTSPKQNAESGSNAQNNAQSITHEKEEKNPESSQSTTKTETKAENPKAVSKSTEKPQDKNQQRKTQHYRHKVNNNRNDFYQKNPRYDTRFMPNRHPYYLATGPIN